MSSSLPNSRPVEADVLERIKKIVGPKGCVTDPAEIEPHCVSWRDNWKGWVPLVVKPANTAELAEVVKVCAETGTAIVPQGGNTGLTGASQPHDDGSEIIVSTSRMNAIRDVDLANDTMTVEAGCILQSIQSAADEHNRLFPLSLAAEGSCQIGGNLATNAGGTQVLRYGNTRALVLGVEVVLPDGRIWDGLRSLRKDNTGYDLKQYFIGSEGTLGIITAAVLKLFPKPTDVQTCFVAVRDVAAAVELLGNARAIVGDQVTTFELIQRYGVEMTVRNVPGVVDPMEQAHDWYVLMEIAGQGAPGTLAADVEQCLAQGFEAGIVVDAVIAANRAQAQSMWAIREKIPEAQNHEGASIKHDVSVSISRIPEFIDKACERLDAAFPGCRPVAFGHVGDGNIHFNIGQPAGTDGEAFYKLYPDVNKVVHDLISQMNGSISAEHGLGRLRMHEAERYKSDVELDVMRAIKTTLDPGNIMNPGKVVSIARPEAPDV